MSKDEIEGKETAEERCLRRMPQAPAEMEENERDVTEPTDAQIHRDREEEKTDNRKDWKDDETSAVDRGGKENPRAGV